MRTRLRATALVLASLALGAPAWAQSGGSTPQSPPAPAPAVPAPNPPNAETPPGGVARGVVPPPANVDPQMVEKPPATGGMPVIPPPAAAK